MRTRIISLALSVLMLVCLFPAAVADEQDGWSVIGNICETNWDTDFPMTETEPGVWTSGELGLHEGEMLKVRLGGSWDMDYGTAFDWDGSAPVICVQGGRNLVIPTDGTYVVTLYLSDPVTITLTDPNGDTVLPRTEGEGGQDDPDPFDPFAYSWTVIGSIFDTTWNQDFQMTETETGVWQAGPWALHAGEEFKVRANCDWEIWSYGNETGDNCVVEEDGTYFITLNLNNDPVFVTWELTDQEPEEPTIVTPPSEYDRVPLTEEYFPDANFRAWIAAQDGWTEEEDGVTYVTGSALQNDVIDCPGLGIEDLTGVEYFTELISLNCADRWDDDGKHVNNITALDLSGNTKLVSLNAACNKLTELDVSMLSELKWLILDLNELETLEVNHGALEQCHCAGNHLTELDVSDNPNLWDLQCGTVEWWEEDTHYYYANEIRTLNVSNCTRIVDLNCAGNPLETIIANNSKAMRKIKLSEYPNLSRLECADCGLTSLNLSENPNLTHLNCENNRLLKLNFTAADGADPENFLLDGQSMPVTAGARENNGAYTLDMRQIVGDDYGRVRMAGYDPETGVATFAENPDEITYVYQTQPNGDAIGMTVTVQLNVVPEPLPDGAIAINGDHFPDKAFRTWILDNLDYSEDALLSPYLTREQLEAVTTVGWFEASDITGVTLFPNLSRLDCNYISVFPLPLPDYPICGDIVLCPGEPTEGANGTYTFDFSTVLNPAVYPFEQFDTSDWGDDKQLDTDTGVVTFRYRPELEEFRIPETYAYSEDWKDDLYIRLLFDDSQNPNEPGDFPFFVDEYDDPATAFNSAGDDPWIPDQSEWPAAPAYDGSLNGIPIDEAHFPDAIFREWILDNLDHETDGESHWFTAEQRWNVTVIVCLGLHIESLAGIEYFPNLEWLYCGRQGGVYVPEYAFWTYTSNPITEIDLSGNPKLTRLYMGYCKLTEIDLSNNPNLTHLSVFGNRLTELDLSHNGLIEELDFGCNDIRSFDPSQVPNLTVLKCYFTSIAGELDLSERPQLTELRCCNIHGGNLTSLDISGCTGLISTECEIYNFSGMTEFRCRNCGLAELQGGMGNLQILDCGENEQFTSLDLSDYRELRELYCDYCNLYRLDISKNTHLNTVDCSGNHLKQLNFTLVSGGTFNGNDQTGVCAAMMEPNGDGYTFDMSAIVSSENLDRIIAVDGADYDPHTGIAAFADYSEELLYTYRTQHYTASDPCALSVTVTLNVDMPDLPADAIPIDAAHFPDANFRAWILKSLTPYYTEDAFGRQYLTETRYDALYFGMDGWSVASLEGLQYFPNAFSLMCGEGHRQNEDGDWIWHAGALTEVDFSQNPNLVEVYLTGNQLETIDVSCLPILQWLGVKNNRLTTIDVSTNYNLAALYCSGNNLTSMTLPGQTVHVYPLMRGEQQEGRLTRLECEDNALEALDLSMQSELKEISCEDNNLTALDCSENERIGLLDCDDDVAITLPEGMSICAQMTINDGEKTYQCTSLAAAIDKITGRDGVTNPDEVQSAYITVFEDLTGSSLEFAADQQKTVVIDLDGHTYTADSEPALIAYENDVTVINGALIVSTEPTPTFKTHSLMLSGQIGVNFYMDLSMLSAEDLADAEKTYMTFTISGKGTVSSDPVPVNDNQKNSKGALYGFTCYVNSIQMADTITATFHYGDGLTISETYSIRQYIVSFDTYIADHPGVYDDETINLVHALADYGHYIQLFLAGTKGWTLGTGDDQYAEMNTFYTDSYDHDSVTDSLSGCAISVSNGDTNIRSLAFSVVFDSETAIRLTMKPVTGFTGALTILHDNNNHTVELKSGRWMYEIANIPAHRLGDSHTIMARTDNSDGDWSACMTIGNISVMSYVLQMLQHGNDAMKDAGAALYIYWQAAVAFKTQHP